MSSVIGTYIIAVPEEYAGKSISIRIRARGYDGRLGSVTAIHGIPTASPLTGSLQGPSPSLGATVRREVVAPAASLFGPRVALSGAMDRQGPIHFAGGMVAPYPILQGHSARGLPTSGVLVAPAPSLSGVAERVLEASGGLYGPVALIAGDMDSITEWLASGAITGPAAVLEAVVEIEEAPAGIPAQYIPNSAQTTVNGTFVVKEESQVEGATLIGISLNGSGQAQTAPEGWTTLTDLTANNATVSAYARRWEPGMPDGVVGNGERAFVVGMLGVDPDLSKIEVVRDTGLNDPVRYPAIEAGENEAIIEYFTHRTNFNYEPALSAFFTTQADQYAHMSGLTSYSGNALGIGSGPRELPEEIINSGVIHSGWHTIRMRIPSDAVRKGGFNAFLVGPSALLSGTALHNMVQSAGGDLTAPKATISGEVSLGVPMTPIALAFRHIGTVSSKLNLFLRDTHQHSGQTYDLHNIDEEPSGVTVRFIPSTSNTSASGVGANNKGQYPGGSYDTNGLLSNDTCSHSWFAAQGQQMVYRFEGLQPNTTFLVETVGCLSPSQPYAGTSYLKALDAAGEEVSWNHQGTPAIYSIHATSDSNGVLELLQEGKSGWNFIGGIQISGNIAPGPGPDPDPDPEPDPDPDPPAQFDEGPGDYTVSTTADLKNAMQNAPSGSVIAIMPGTYERINFTGGVSKNPAIRLRPYDRSNPPLWNDTAFDMRNIEGVTFDGLHFISDKYDSTGDWPSGYAMHMHYCKRMTFVNCTWHRFHAHFASSFCEDITYEWCRFGGIGMDYIRAYETYKNLTIRNCIFGGPKGDQWEAQIDASRAHQSGRHPDVVQLANNAVNNGQGMDGFIFEDNIVYGHWVQQCIFMHNERVASGTTTWPHRNLTVRRNYIEAMHVHGIEVGGCDGFLIENNCLRRHPDSDGSQIETPHITILTDHNKNGIIRNNVTRQAIGSPPWTGSMANISLSGNVVSATAWPPNWTMPIVGPYNQPQE